MTREEAVNWLINIMSDIGKSQHRDLWHYEQALAEIKKMLEEEPHWIPCSERLPEEGREVLTCLTDWKTGEQRRVVSYRIDFNMWHEYGRYNEKCVAWMPLPEPWEGDAE